MSRRMAGRPGGRTADGRSVPAHSVKPVAVGVASQFDRTAGILAGRNAGGTTKLRDHRRGYVFVRANFTFRPITERPFPALSVS